MKQQQNIAKNDITTWLGPPFSLRCCHGVTSASCTFLTTASQRQIMIRFRFCVTSQAAALASQEGKLCIMSRDTSTRSRALAAAGGRVPCQCYCPGPLAGMRTEAGRCACPGSTSSSSWQVAVPVTDSQWRSRCTGPARSAEGGGQTVLRAGPTLSCRPDSLAGDSHHDLWFMIRVITIPCYSGPRSLIRSQWPSETAVTVTVTVRDAAGQWAWAVGAAAANSRWHRQQLRLNHDRTRTEAAWQWAWGSCLPVPGRGPPGRRAAPSPSAKQTITISCTISNNFVKYVQ